MCSIAPSYPFCTFQDFTSKSKDLCVPENTNIFGISLDVRINLVKAQYLDLKVIFRFDLVLMLGEFKRVYRFLLHKNLFIMQKSKKGNNRLLIFIYSFHFNVNYVSQFLYKSLHFKFLKSIYLFVYLYIIYKTVSIFILVCALQNMIHLK